MNSYATMLISASVIGFVLYSLISGSLVQYIALAKPAPPSAGAGQPSTAAQTYNAIGAGLSLANPGAALIIQH